MVPVSYTHLDVYKRQTLHRAGTDELSGTVEVLQMHGHLPFHHTVAPVRVTGDKLRGRLFARDARRALEIHVVGLKHVKARDATDHALLHEDVYKRQLVERAVRAIFAVEVLMLLHVRNVPFALGEQLCDCLLYTSRCV